jgi:hypothetical protein
MTIKTTINFNEIQGIHKESVKKSSKNHMIN